MKRRWLIGLMVLLVAAVALSACGGGAPDVDWELKVTGAVAQPLTLSYKELAGRDLTKLENVLMERSEGEPGQNTWEGVLLEGILAEAGVSANATAIIFRAADEYEREIPISEVGQEAIIALKQDGTWLAEDAKTGPIRIVIPGLPGSRWVGQLIEIEVLE